MAGCSLFRISFLLQLFLSANQQKLENESESEWDPRREEMDTFLRAVGLLNSGLSCDLAPPSSGNWQRPVCRENVGCDIPLNCLNYSLSRGRTEGARKVAPLQLELILEGFTNTCAMVMFYAPWCPYSVDFARKFNALGRAYKELPVLAVEFDENDM